MSPEDLPEQIDALLAAPLPLPIVAAGDPVLRRPAEPYQGQLGPRRLEALVEAMRVTMRAAPGVGLAAPQIGVPLQIAVVEDEADVPKEVREVRGRYPLPFRVLINPAYAAAGPRRVAFFEGCLSVPGWQAVVARPERVRLRATDLAGRPVDEVFSGWAARIVQHETDHLAGTLYLDLAELRSLSGARAMAERWNRPTPRHAARELGFPLPAGQEDA
ncbi:peptide deformylase [Streptomyces sp. NA04227]|uniref:peptide deformylase n=1 Tax=Streptomyces sp. NA04227 TaxID=2742136 RepID=UPI0020CA619A|nr:peptide deformylase [Streptomyces sp. NA04227]